MRIPKRFTKFIDEVGEDKIKKLKKYIKTHKVGGGYVGSGKLGKALKDNWKKILLAIGIPATKIGIALFKHMVDKKYGNHSSSLPELDFMTDLSGNKIKSGLEYGLDVMHDGGGETPISIHDIKFHSSVKKKMLKTLEEIEQGHYGSGREERLKRKHERQEKRAKRKEIRKSKERKGLKAFIQGKTKFKPSTLLKWISSVAGVFSFIPGINILASGVSAVSGVASSMLKQSGKGIKLSGEGIGYGIGSGIGSGIHQSGYGMIPSFVKEFINKNVKTTTSIVKHIVKGKKLGKRVAGVAGAMTVFTWLNRNKQLFNMVGKYIKGLGRTINSSILENSGELLQKVSGGDVRKLGYGVSLAGGNDGNPAPLHKQQVKHKRHKIKSRGSREEVYNGLAKKTSGGLIKSDLMLNGRGKIVSKKKSQMGKKLYKYLGKNKK